MSPIPCLSPTYIHTYSILLISPNLHLYLLWQPSRQSRHFAISPSLCVSLLHSQLLSPFSPILHTFIHYIHSPLIQPLPMWKHRPSSRSDSTGPFDLHHQPSSSPRNWFGRSKKKSPLCKSISPFYLLSSLSSYSSFWECLLHSSLPSVIPSFSHSFVSVSFLVSRFITVPEGR